MSEISNERRKQMYQDDEIIPAFENDRRVFRGAPKGVRRLMRNKYHYLNKGETERPAQEESK